MNKNSPLVSIVIPVYNVEKYLNESVDSVLRQTCSNYEVILVDDGSTDQSGLMCDEYLKVSDKITVIHQENGGLSAARNTGLKASQGEYVYFLDSDDYIEDCALEHLLDTAIKESSDIVFFDGYVFFDGCEDDPTMSRYIRQDQYKTQNGRNMLLELLQKDEYRTPVQLMLFRREYLIMNNLWFLNGILHEDELFTFAVFNADGAVAHCHEQLYARRIRPGSIMTASKMLRRYESMLTIYQEIEREYQNENAKGEAVRLYLIRMAKSVWWRYQNLDEQDREMVVASYYSFKKNVLKNNGFGDYKLKIKCSDGLLRFEYRLVYKIQRMFKKET